MDYWKKQNGNHTHQSGTNQAGQLKWYTQNKVQMYELTLGKTNQNQ
jgi:hypothetical protein